MQICTCAEQSHALCALCTRIYIVLFYALACLHAHRTHLSVSSGQPFLIPNSQGGEWIVELWFLLKIHHPSFPLAPIGHIAFAIGKYIASLWDISRASHISRTLLRAHIRVPRTLLVRSTRLHPFSKGGWIAHVSASGVRNGGFSRARRAYRICQRQIYRIPPIGVYIACIAHIAHAFACSFVQRTAITPWRVYHHAPAVHLAA